MVFLSFMEAKANNLFVYRSGDNNMYLLLYINNIIITTTHPELLQCTTTTLQLEFAIKDLGPLHNFMGILVEQQTRQPERASMTDIKPCATPMDTQVKVSSDVSVPDSDPAIGRSLVGVLQYLTFTRLDISYVVQQVCLHTHDPTEPHLAAVKRVLHYL
jgi:hypothetical protein